MNQFTLLVIILVVFTYYGGSNVPKILRDNKEMLLGVVGGLVLCSFLGMRLEGVGGGNGATGGNGASVPCEEHFGPSVFGRPHQWRNGPECKEDGGVWRNDKCCTE